MSEKEHRLGRRDSLGNEGEKELAVSQRINQLQTQ